MSSGSSDPVSADQAVDWPRPLPGPSSLTRFFWESGKDGLLRFMRCADCRRFHHPPSPICPDCHSRAVAPEPVSGLGVVHSFSVNHQDWTRSGELPFVYAVIELEEQTGLRMTANVVDCPPEAVFVGMEVAVRFLAVEDVHLPLFAPRAEAAA